MLTAFCSAQTAYPADTVLTLEETSVTEKALVTPISLWQRLSYNVPFLECQFYPSCSNYAAQSISEHGIFVGTAVAADRLVRCNPAAFHYHLRDRDLSLPVSTAFYSDGRLVDPVPAVPFLRTTSMKKSPAMAAALSALLPGAGRVYVGRSWDGVFGFLTFALAAQATTVSAQRENGLGLALFGLTTVAFYAGEIVGAYRAADGPVHRIPG